MAIETITPDFFDWLSAAFSVWWRVFIPGLLLVLGLIYVGMAVRMGPVTAAKSYIRAIPETLKDLIFISPRRVYALSKLAVLESIRRMVLATFVVFVVVLLFAGWYLDPGSNNPAQLYLSFVLTATSYLVLLLALFLSVFSLPNDIKHRTITTVVTKPVRASEIVLGRVIGFSFTCTVLLVMTGVFSYVFVIRGLDHTHEIPESALVTEVDDNDVPTGYLIGDTATESGHKHRFRIDPETGRGQTDRVQGHFHVIEAQEIGGRKRYIVSSPQDILEARVPIYGQLRFTDRSGAPSAQGISVGKEKAYQSWIEGGTLASATWTFQGLQRDMFGRTLPLELNLGVFRTHKGDVRRTILGSIVLRTPAEAVADGRASEVRSTPPFNFSTQEYRSDLQRIPLEMTGPDGETIDVFRDIVVDGAVEVQITCLEPGQYLGMARPDVYIRADDASFAMNFFKGYIGIWLQMILIVAIGVTLSTFLNAPVALLGTLAAILGGYVKGFIFNVATGSTLGGGPFESLIRLVTQKNVTGALEPGIGTDIAIRADWVYQRILGVIYWMLPDLSALSDVGYVTSGFDIPLDRIAAHLVMTLAYLLPIMVAGYLLLKSREVAK